MKPRIDICGRREVTGRIARGHYGYIVSINDLTDSTPPEGFEYVPHRLELRFDDVTYVDAGYRLGYSPPTEDDIDAIVHFGNLIKVASVDPEMQPQVLVHCAAGISRSTAAAYILWCVVLGPGREAEAFEEVKLARPIARPNRLMVEYANTRLKRDGKMLEALTG